MRARAAGTRRLARSARDACRLASVRLFCANLQMDAPRAGGGLAAVIHVGRNAASRCRARLLLKDSNSKFGRLFSHT